MYNAAGEIHPANTPYMTPSTFKDGDTMGIAFDLDTGSFTFYHNGESLGTLGGTGNNGKDYTIGAADHSGSANANTLKINMAPQYDIPTGYSWWM